MQHFHIRKILNSCLSRLTQSYFPWVHAAGSRVLSIVKLKKLFPIILCSLMLQINNTSYADNYTKDINGLRKDILEINEKLSSIEQEIKNTDIKISEKAKALNKVNKNLKQTEQQKDQIQKSQQKNLANLEEQKQILIKQLNSMYILHRNEQDNNFVKLSKLENIEQLNRFINYIKAYKEYNISSIQEIRLSLLRLNSLNENLDLIAEQQKKLQKNIEKSYQELNLLKARNLRAKKELQQSLNTQLASLDYYQNQQNKLNNILNKDITENKNNNNQFKNLIGIFQNSKGKLPLPVTGEISKEFKTGKNKNSIFINTNEGQEVAAIFSGKVVFSNWLRGFGFITIVDHGDGYMSLYGNNQALFKKADDFVEAGETIALTGSSGGINKSGLFFEIRYNGTSIDTASWIDSDSVKSYS